MKTIYVIRSLLFGTRRDIVSISVLLVFSIISALTTFLSVFSLYPLLQMFTEYDQAISQFPLTYIAELFGNAPKEDFIYAFTLITILVLFFSMIIQVSEGIVVSTYCSFKEAWISSDYYTRFINDPYKLFLARNSSEESKNILSDSAAAIGFFIKPVIQLFVCSVTITVLVASLFFINPKVGIFLLLAVLMLYLLLYLSFTRSLKRIGRSRTTNNEERFKLVDDAISSMAEIKIYSANEIFIEQFKRISQKYAKSVALSQIVAASPKFIIEGLGSIAIVIYMFISFSSTSGLEKAIANLAIYLFILYKLLPQVQKVYSAFINLRYSAEFVNNISQRIVKEEYKQPLSDNFSKTTIKNIDKLEFKEISFTYPGSNDCIFSNLNLKLLKGNYYAIVGESGTGKTTFLNILSGLNDDFEGEFLVDGQKFEIIDLKNFWKCISYVPQESAIFNGSIAENVALSDLKKLDIDKVLFSLEQADFGANKLKESNLDVSTLVGTGGQRLSGGQKQRIAIARALYNQPSILILDEATSALDEKSESVVLTNIKESQDKIIISVAHRKSAIEIADFQVTLNENTH